MSSRALRKAQREREEQERAHVSQQEEDNGDDADNAPAPLAKKSAFALLDGEANEDEGGASPADEDPDEVANEPASDHAPQPAGKKSKKKKKKKSKKATPSGATDNKDELDEIDKALKQLSAGGPASQTGETAAGVNAVIDETSRLLAIDTSHLHAQNEMRRLFGRAALEQQDDDQPAPNANAGGNRRQQRQGQQAGLAQALRGQGGAGGRSGGLAAMALRRNIFIQGKEEWPIATGGGLGMEIEERRADGTILYRFVHNRVYQDVQFQFESCVESMDPNRLVVLLQHNPYHISTLLQVSEIAKQERDHATSGDLLERALFSFGRAVHSTFAKALAEGKARLDFARAENREFWLASWRYMQNLSMRATWRTVYEWAKLLLALSPEEDPYALWLVLDQYALRSRQDLDYLNISRNATFKELHLNQPHVQLSQGLAECRAGNKSKGEQVLFTAIGRFPWVVARLMQELAIDPPPGVWGKEPRTDKERFYSELYAARAKDLWNTPETSALLTEVAAAIPPDTPAAPPDTSEITQSEARHVLLSDTPALIALLPRHYTSRMSSASDPLTPDNALPSYTADQSRRATPRTHPTGVSTPADELRELQGLYGFFANLFPWFAAAQRDEEGDAVRPSEEEINRRIQESGVSEEVILTRTQRMMQLQTSLAGTRNPGEQDETEATAADDPPGEATGMRVRVEDASDEEQA